MRGFVHFCWFCGICDVSPDSRDCFRSYFSNLIQFGRKLTWIFMIGIHFRVRSSQSDFALSAQMFDGFPTSFLFSLSLENLWVTIQPRKCRRTARNASTSTVLRNFVTAFWEALTSSTWGSELRGASLSKVILARKSSR